MAQSLCDSGHQIVIFSGRSKGTIHTTKQWLNKHNVPWHRLFMRPVKDFTPDDVLKQDWLNDIGKDNVLCTFDDRNKVVDMGRDFIRMVSLVFKSQMVTFKFGYL